MSGAKALKNRIVSVKNTSKITKTMEMVSTAKSKRLVDKVNAAKPYGDKIVEIMKSLSGLEGQVDSPLLRKVENPKSYLLFVVTANRGLCGGYNTNILKMARKRMEELRSEGKEVHLHVVGKKGVSFFKFMKEKMDETYIDIDDTLTYDRALELANYFMDSFIKRKFDRVEVLSTVYESSARQVPQNTVILPLGMDSSSDSEEPAPSAGSMVYEQDPALILENLMPHLVRTTVFRLLLEAVTSEQIYRRIAMKSASDAAGEMMKSLNRTYNRVRQASITQELSEIVAGADAIS